MGVYIKGMDMPKSCYYCSLTNDGFYLCMATQPFKQLEDECEERRPNWCPLTEVPEPHGPLVDEDLIIERAKYWLVGGTDGHTLNDFLNEFLNFAEIPTVIERSNNEKSINTTK